MRRALARQLGGERDGIRGPQLAVADDELAADEQRVDGARGAERERRHGIGDAGEAQLAEIPERDVRQRADAEVPELVVAAQAAGAVARGQLERLARGQRRGAAGDAREHERRAQLVDQLAALVRGGAVDAEPDGRARGEQRRDGRDARAQPAVGGRAVRDAGAGRAHPLRLAAVEVHAVREPDVVAEPAQAVEVLERPLPEALEAERLLVVGLGEMSVQAHAAGAGELRRLRHQLAADREGRRRCERDPHHRARLGIVEAVDRGGAGREDRIALLDDARRAAGRPCCGRGPSRHGTGGSAARSPARPRSRPPAGRRRGAGRCSGGRSRSCNPSAPARRVRRGRRRRRRRRRCAPRRGRARRATRTASPAAHSRASRAGRGGGGS